MSLESVISDLVTETKGLLSYFTGAKKGIETAVASAIAAVPAMQKTWYVDQLAGLDTNDGLTRDTAFRSIAKAMAATPANGICFVNLLSDYTMTDTPALTVGYLIINGNGAVRNLFPKYYQSTDAAGVTTTGMGGFSAWSQGYNVELRYCNLVLPSPAGQVPAPSTTRSCSFVRTNSGANLPPYVGLVMQGIAVTMPSDFYGALVGLSASSAVLTVAGGTFPAGMLGHYFSNVTNPAGTNPQTLSTVLTNLSLI
ncbi:hypothetical protein ACVWYU_000972 [Pseudomonas sp. TE12234]